MEADSTPIVSRSRRKTFTVQQQPVPTPGGMCNRTFIASGGEGAPAPPPPPVFLQNGILPPRIITDNPARRNIDGGFLNVTRSNPPASTHSSSLAFPQQHHEDLNSITALLNKVQCFKYETKCKNVHLEATSEHIEKFANKAYQRIQNVGAVEDDGNKCDTTTESEDGIFEATTVERSPNPKNNGNLDMLRLENRVLLEKLEKTASCSSFLDVAKTDELSALVKSKHTAVSKLEEAKKRRCNVNNEIQKTKLETAKRSEIREKIICKVDMVQSLAAILFKISDDVLCTDKMLCDLLVKDPTKKCCKSGAVPFTHNNTSN